MKYKSMIINNILRFSLVLILCLIGGSMSAKTFEFAPDTTSVIRNPLQGWVMYLGRTWDENFWETQGYDKITVNGSEEKVRVSDYASCAYIRTSWSSLEPEEGKYIWEDPDSRLMKLLKSVSDRGLKLAFRVVIDGRDQGQNTPQYVFDAGAQGYYDPKNPGKNLSPYPDDPVFQEKYSKFFKAFGERFDNPSEVEFIDAYSLGKWGESHSMIYEDNNNKLSVFEWMIDLASESFKKVPTVIHYHRMLGDPDDDGWGNVSKDTDHMLNYAVDKGFILRHDAFGMTGYYQDWEKETAANWNNIRPIIMEGGWITGAHHRYWRDPSGNYREGHPEDVRLGEFLASEEAKVNMMDLRINDETRSWFQDSFPLVKEFIKRGGYRLYPSSVTIEETATPNSAIDIVSEWKNIGWGYCPTNIPQWNQKFKIGFALLDENNRPVKTFIEKKSDLSKWTRNNSGKYTTKVDLTGIPNGNYTWGVALVDVTDNNQPAIKMAVDSADYDGEWLRIGNLQIKNN
ncbi:MAG: DUF4832 domain-containing protein [Muribaculaceae bacterium]|nr:DUF4832 domain-containing protein [Muribaculaceae bacterium]